MEQRDYLLREIERIGQVLRAILNRITGRGSAPPISIDKQFVKTRNELLDMANFDLSEFIQMSGQNALEYIDNLAGFHTSNIEQLAQILEQLAIDEETNRRVDLLQKSLLLLDYCKKQDKTFSLDRENQILRITDSLNKS